MTWVLRESMFCMYHVRICMYLAVSACILMYVYAWPSSSWWHFFARTKVTSVPTGGRRSGQGCVAGCSWCISVTQDATTTWESKYPGCSSRLFALLLSCSTLFWGIWFTSSEQCLERSTGSSSVTLVSREIP